MDPIESFRRRVVADIEAVGGRHDEIDLYGGEVGDPGLVGGPDSVSWELHGDLAVVSAAGSAAIVMEVLHPSVMAGVSQQSTFRTEPIKRAQNTLGYVLRTTFGSTPAATAVIDKVRHIHSFVEGIRPDGQPYRALDPELLAWVHTCIPWAIMTAYDRYRRPLSRDEKDRYLAEQAVVGRMGGGEGVPTSVDELDAFVERIRPQLAVNEQTLEFIRFLAEGAVEGQVVGAREKAERWMGLRGSMMLMPRWARELTGLDHGNPAARALSDRLERLKVSVVGWAVPELPCAAMARRRVEGTPETAELTGSAA